MRLIITEDRAVSRDLDGNILVWDMNKAIEAEQKRSNVRKAAHCLIFAKFASSQSNKKALIMVRFFYICIQMAGIYAI